MKTKTPRITWMGKDIRDYKGRYAHESWTHYQLRKFTNALSRAIMISAKVTLMAWLMVGAMFFGINYSKGNQISYVAPAFAATVTPATPDFPILDKIAKAESYNSQTCTKAIVAKGGCHAYEIGSTLIHVNANGTYDIGRWAINSTHLADAIARGFVVYTEAGNKAYAEYLFETQGSVPWTASQSVWSH
jgi:hypothetical protein